MLRAYKKGYYKEKGLQMLTHQVEKINECTWRINEFNLVNAFLLEGKKKSALIDTGCGLGKIDKCVKEITDKMLYVLLTHSHPDHAGGVYHFKGLPIYMNSDDDSLKLWGMRTDNGFRRMYIDTRGPRLYDGEVRNLYSLLPNDNPDCTSFDYISIDDGSIIDLGERTLECIHTPGHTDGSICFLDRKNRLLFSGDTINRSIILMRQPDNSTKLIKIFHDSLLKIWSHEKEFDSLIIGHGNPILEKSIIKDYLKITDGLLSGNLRGSYEESGFRKGDVIRYGNAELWYQCDS